KEQLPDLPFGDAKAPLGTAAEMTGELEAAGFHDAAAHAVVHSMDAPDAAALSASLRRTFAPLVLLKHRLGDGAFRPIADAIDARVAEVAGPGPVKVTMPAWVGVATA